MTDPAQDSAQDTPLSTPLDLLLADAAATPLRRFVPGMSGLRFAAGLLRHPRRVAVRAAGAAGELARVGIGRSEVAPDEKDRRFGDDAWAKNPLFRRALQSYLVAGEAARGLVDDAGLDRGDDHRVRFVVDNLVEATAPTNHPLTNPKVLKRTLDTGGGNLVAGGRRFVRDFATAPRVPSMVEPDAFEVGTDLAATPGAVVLRTEQLELIQYAPQTDRVREVPVLIVPPTINKYYVLDLAEERSLVEHLVRSGLTVFCISWRNPDVRHADWDLDTYGAAVLEALDAVQAISRRRTTSVLGLCAGGMLTSMVMAHLAAVGEMDRVASLSLAVTMIDQRRSAIMSTLMSHKTAAASTQLSAERGYLDGRTLAEVFAWLRPNDLVWNYWVNNYLMGHAPKPFDILYWNADPVRLSAGLHRDFMDLALRNGLVETGATTMLGSPVDLSAVSCDSYVVAGIADHLCQWQSCYQATQELGGETRFVLSTSGHIAAMVNPPGNPKASFRTSAVRDGSPYNPADAEEWLEVAVTQRGSWWEDYVTWLHERSGSERGKPRRLGNAAHEPLADAPGTYVHDR